MKLSPVLKYSDLLMRSIIRDGLPEQIFQWPIVENVSTTVLRGSGESTSYHGFVTVRENGKQVWRGENYKTENNNHLKALYGERLVRIGTQQNVVLYSLKPI